MRLTGGQIVAEALIKWGVPYIAGIPGHGCLGLVDAFQGREDRIKLLQARHEQSAVHLADAYYRVSGQPLAVFTSIGPGAVNTAVGVATAFVDSTAVLVLTGDVHTHMYGRGVLQELERHRWADWPRILEPIVKRYWQVTKVEHLPYALHRAFVHMTQGRPGPVLIDLPMDIQAEAAEVEIPELASRTASGRAQGDPKLIAQVAMKLLQAQRPVILAGGGVITSGASPELKEVAELLGAAVVTTMMGKGTFPEDHPLSGLHTGFIGTSAGSALTRQADVILALGCRFADMTTSSYRDGVNFSIPPTALIQVDIDPAEIGKNYPVEVGIVGDIKAALAALKKELASAGKRPGWKDAPYTAEIQNLKAKWGAEIAELRDSERVPVTMARFFKELRAFLDRDAILVTSAGHPQALAFQQFPVYEPRTFITSGGFSTMGFTLPGAIGAKLAAPHRQVVGVAGDGDFMMTMEELATAVQYEVPVVIAILNNCGWCSIRDLQMGRFGESRTLATEFRRPGGEPYTPNFAQVARAFGAYGERIERPEDIRPALERAFSSGKPAVVEVMVNQEPPYSGGPAVGWWDVPVPAYLTAQRRAYEEARGEERLS